MTDDHLSAKKKPAVGRVKCMAMTGKNGGNVRCSHFAREGSRYCYLHQRKMSEPRAPEKKIRDFADAIPQKLRGRFREVLDDPELLSVRSDVAVIRLRQEELLGRLETREAASVWEQLQSAWAEFTRASNEARMARESGDAEKQAKAQEKSAAMLTEVGKLIVRGGSIDSIWGEVVDVTEQAVTIKRAEHARIRDQQAAIAYQDVAMLAGALLESVIRNTPDQRRLNRITADFEESLRVQGITSAAVLSSVAASFNPSSYGAGVGVGDVHHGDVHGDGDGRGDGQGDGASRGAVAGDDAATNSVDSEFVGEVEGGGEGGVGEGRGQEKT